MHSNILSAVGELIEQRTKVQLVRDWEKDRADVVRRRELATQIIAFFGWMSGVLQANFGIGAVRQV